MSMDASKLNHLIYRHLKDQGFHSAADELQRHNTQVTTEISTSLLDIYSSWLNDSEKERKADLAKHSSFKHGGRMSAEATPRKKKDKPGKKAAIQKKTPVKRKKRESRSPVNVIQAKKSKVVSAGGDDSDSDSSLDVEKWKNRVLQMTEADEAKMDIINALDCSASPPKKKVVRKLQAKSPTNTNSMVQQKKGVKKQKVEKVVTDTPAKNIKPKESRPEMSGPVTSATLSQEQNNAEADRQATSTLSLPKQTTEDKSEVSPSGKKKDDRMSKSKTKKKKKKRETIDGNLEENTNVTGEDGKENDSNEEKKNKNEDMEQEFSDETVKMKKRGPKGNETEEEILENNQNGNVDNEETGELEGQEKKAKKKKKEKSHGEETSEQRAEEHVVEKKKTTSEEASEQIVEEDAEHLELVAEKVKENTEPMVHKKRAKKEKKKHAKDSVNTAENEENSEQVIKKKKKRKYDKDNDNAQISEQIAEENMTSEGRDGRGKLQQNTGVNENIEDSLENDSAPPPALNSGISSPRKEKKKKKSKLNSDEVREKPAVSVQDAEATQTLLTPSSSTHKKKKKSSKSSES